MRLPKKLSMTKLVFSYQKELKEIERKLVDPYVPDNEKLFLNERLFVILKELGDLEKELDSKNKND